MKTQDEEDQGNDINLANEQISASLSVIAADVSQVKEAHKDISELQNSVGKTSTAVEQVKTAVEDVNLSLATLRREILNEIYAFRDQSPYPTLTAISRSSDMDRADLGIKLDTLNEYLTKLRLGKGTLSDLEIWELTWDFVEIYRQFGEVAVEMVLKG
jgi:hypothetical protein